MTKLRHMLIALKFSEIRKLTTVAALGLAMLPATGGTASAEFPEQPIKLIVPFSPGGRTDLIARKIVGAIEENDLLSQPIVIVNVPGGGGTIGAAQAKDAEADGYTILHWNYTLMIRELMGVSDFNHEDFESLGFTGGGTAVWAVHDESGLEDLNTIIARLKDEPRSLSEAVNIGSAPHIVGELLKKEAGIETQLVNISNGGEIISGLLGQHVDIGWVPAANFLNYVDSPMHAVVYFGAERHPRLPDVPTAKEYGYDVTWSNPAWWLAPKGVPEDRVEVLATALQKAIELPEIVTWFEENALNPYWTGPEESMSDAIASYPRLRSITETIE